MRRLLSIFILLSALFCVQQAQAQSVGPLTFQSTGAIGNGVAEPTSGLTIATAQIIGAGGFDRTINWEVTEDGTNFVSVFCRNIATNAIAITATANGVYVCSIPGASLFRARGYELLNEEHL